MGLLALIHPEVVWLCLRLSTIRQTYDGNGLNLLPQGSLTLLITSKTSTKRIDV